MSSPNLKCFICNNEKLDDNLSKVPPRGYTSLQTNVNNVDDEVILQRFRVYWNDGIESVLTCDSQCRTSLFNKKKSVVSLNGIYIYIIFFLFLSYVFLSCSWWFWTLNLVKTFSQVKVQRVVPRRVWRDVEQLQNLTHQRQIPQIVFFRTVKRAYYVMNLLTYKSYVATLVRCCGQNLLYESSNYDIELFCKCIHKKCIICYV